MKTRIMIVFLLASSFCLLSPALHAQQVTLSTPIQYNNFAVGNNLLSLQHSTNATGHLLSLLNTAGTEISFFDKNGVLTSPGANFANTTNPMTISCTAPAAAADCLTVSFGPASSTSNLLTLKDTAANTGTGYLLNIANGAAALTNSLQIVASAQTASPSNSQVLIKDATGNTNTGALVNINTVGTSTALPLVVTAQGTSNGIQMNTTGLISALGTGGIKVSDGEVFIPATTAGCLATPTTVTIASPQLYARAALNNTVYTVTTNSAAGSFEIDCDLAQGLPTRTTASKGISITAINVYYGSVTNTPTSIANAQFATITYPAVGGAASGTVSSALATTVTPGMSHSTPVATTTGQCVNEGNVLTTPLLFTALIPRITYSQVFSQSAAAVTNVQVCGFQVLYTNQIL